MNIFGLLIGIYPKHEKKIKFFMFSYALNEIIIPI
jgi:hypothetical protein